MRNRYHSEARCGRWLLNRGTASPWSGGELLREELFSIERLEEHAASLAAAQLITGRPPRRRPLHVRLKDNESALLAAYRATAAAVAEGRAITPSAEWVLDNYHLVEEQIREIREDLPPGFYRQLPKLSEGPFAGYPRVFGLAWAFVAHTDSRFDPEALRRFLRAYQRIQPLTIGELWAVAITLRIVLVENLRRAAQSSVSARLARQQADGVADRLLGVNGCLSEPDALQRGDDPAVALPGDFAAQLVQRLRDQDPRVTPALTWLEQRLAAQGTTSADIVRAEHQRQGASNVTVRNIITSMRLISDVDWAELFESVSLTDELLRAGSGFAEMDFATRNLYRSAIEHLSRRSRLTELQVAERALGPVDAAGDGDEGRRKRDPGFRLIGRGRSDFERSIRYRATAGGAATRLLITRGASCYLGMIALAALGVLLLPLDALASIGIGASRLAALAAVALIPAIDAAVALVNRLVTGSVGASILPGLALRAGVPAPLRTLVAVPILLTTEDAVAEQIARLEVHHLASLEGEIYFALLSDWPDSASERMPADAALLEAANAGIAELNARYPRGEAGERFLLLHRRRVWSESERCWMGWERKRGKIHELNQLLRGGLATTFLGPGGLPPAVPPDVRFVITLDADTRLPRDAARRLIGKLAHPLNRPRFDARVGCVVDGYAILQPRITPSLPLGREGSVFQRVFSSTPGIDPYASASSDVYQDLFGEGSYTGKGIYDVDAFEAALAGRAPDDALLSHDLFEGIFARAGLVSDIEVVEDFPQRYDVATLRQHRWARGDWQLLPWIFGRGDADATRRGGHGALSVISRWKIIDNLRRSLSAPAAVGALLAGWALPPHAALIWTAFILGTIALSPAMAVIAAIVPRRTGITARSHARAFRIDLQLASAQFALLLTFLAHQAWSATDAVLRSLYRVCLSRRNLLEWVTAAQSGAGSRLTLVAMYRYMHGGVLIGVATLLLAAFASSGTAWVAIPFAILWMWSPVVARWVSSEPAVGRRLTVAPADAVELRATARRTWRFFEVFVTETDNDLPPDNFQETPLPVLAHRTSPTNIGLYLLSIISARDFGWIGTSDAILRLERTLATLARLRRCRGHFYNWYETRDLSVLEPGYVSTVDSGNLAAHLIATASTCHEWAGQLPTHDTSLAGIRDSLSLAAEAAGALPPAPHSALTLRRELDAALERLGKLLGAASGAAPGAALQLTELADHAMTLADIAHALDGDGAAAEIAGDLTYWAEATRHSIESLIRDRSLTDLGVAALRARAHSVAVTTTAMAEAMDFSFLMNAERRLLSIGFREADGTLDPSCYDLLASEARLASFVAIAKGDVPTRHWFRLGRPVTPVGHGAALVSWSGSMFEYLMPSLVMRAPAGSLLEQTSRLVVRRQIDYAQRLDIPWGVSESAYNARDLELTYQYSNFGVPGLGLKRGLRENVVIAPYATALAAMVDPEAAARNFERLEATGARGRFGYYEALDYTRARVPDGATVAIVRAFMAHHQGMTIVALANALLDGQMRSRFHANASVQATELLLQERTPRDVSVARPRAEGVMKAPPMADALLPHVRRIRGTADPSPQTHLLSNGRYSVMLTAAGSGYSRWNDLAITRWREDLTREDSGSYILLRDAVSGAEWSAGYQPSGAEPTDYEATFTEDRAEIVRRDGTLTTTLEVVVSPEDDAEVRRVSIVNLGFRAREVDVTSYCELVLAPLAADIAHPAFSKLFVQTEFVSAVGALLATRRKRTPSDPDIWAAHHAVVEADASGDVQVETDRARFVGRGRELRTAVASGSDRALSGSVGHVLDPVFALRHRVRVPPGGTVRIAFWTATGRSREQVLNLVDKHHEPNAFARACTLAWTQAQVQLRHLGIDAAEAALFQRLAGYVLFADASMRPSADVILRGAGGPESLWSQGISGDVPIVLLRIADIEDVPLARQLLRAHEYWRSKRLAVDLVILNERASSYIQDLQGTLETALRTSQSRPRVGGDSADGSVFVLRADLITTETRAMLSAVARVALYAPRGSLEEQLDRARAAPVPAPPIWPRVGPRAGSPTAPVPPPDLEFFNGLGGFTAGGREYVTLLAAGQTTPAPWINVIANPKFGFQVAADGSGYTWALNSREYQLTPWSNDAVTDRPGEVIYLRDEDSGEIWTATAAPIRADTSGGFTARHGQGYSRFEHASHGIGLDLLQFVPVADSVKVSRLAISNHSPRPRRLSVTVYLEWVLGAARSASAPSVVTSIDSQTGALFAGNPGNATFGTQIAFADLRGQQSGWTGDRTEFLGRFGTLSDPAALRARRPLSKRVGAGLDPCGVLQATVRLEANASAEVVVLVGSAASVADARAVLARYRTVDLDDVLRDVARQWDDVLGTVQVTTPDRSLDLMLNRWLLYQTLACRIWARSAFYQASGAYGFRDQLQDGMALAVSSPGVTRAHLLNAAGRQFALGDVQHWWLPQTGRGVRTKIADDRVWLAYATAHYVETTGDVALLDESVPFLEGQTLGPGEHEAYFQPSIADERASVYEHCARALDLSLAVGVHGLPLMGTGDWNDGMNRVGELGRGESVWLGWFVHATLSAFAPIALRRGETGRNARWIAHAAALRTSLEESGWDGDWYRRAFFDDGTPLGSAANAECRIDAIAQSWSVISGAADPSRAVLAMRAATDQLVRPAAGLALLFTPPFDRTMLDPGYVKGYPPGVRENGGQYTHAAAWSVIALAMLGQGDAAMRLLSMLNPVNRASTRANAQRYKVEPYVVAADIYSVAPHVGRGGWTWYTGSSGWLYRAGLEWILGFRRQGDSLLIAPCIPRDWPRVDIRFRHGSARYEIVIENPDGTGRGVRDAYLDGLRLPPGEARILLVDDGAPHHLQVTLGVEADTGSRP
jgi:cyclic beta-1,2-glucan synthetase